MKATKRLNREIAYEGSILTFYKDTIETPNGDIVTYDTVHHKMGAAAIVAVTVDGKIVMVHQYRNALDRFTLELPAGARDSISEDTLFTAKRELEEETGYKCEEIVPLIKLRSTVAFCDEFIDVYLATGLKIKGDQNLDPEESIDIEEFILDDLLDMIYAGKIQDAKTVAGLFAYEHLLKSKSKPGNNNLM